MTETILDCCIIGAGPAGLQAGYKMAGMGMNVRLLERGQVGQFFRQFPRHRTLISINKVHTGLTDPETKLRYDWNSLLNDDGVLFPDVSKKYFPNADVYVEYLMQFATLLGDRITEGCEVTRISKTDDLFTLECADGTAWQARSVIVATGVSRTWDPEIQGWDLVDKYADFDTDGAQFDDKRVLVVGKGNSAFETADALIEHAQAIHVMSPNPLKLAWNTHFVGHLRAVNNNFLDTYQLKSQNAVIDAAIKRVERNPDGSLRVTADMTAAKGHEIVLDYDRVIACTGFRFDASIFDAAIRPALRHMDKFPAMTSQWESENTEGLYFAGTIMQCRDFKKTMSGFVHGFRHNVECLVDFIAARQGVTPIPSDSVPMQREALADTLIDRFSTNATLFLQPGFMCDAIILSGTDAGKRLKGVPIAWLREQDDLRAQGLLVLSMEFGDFGDSPMHVKRENTLRGDHADPFIHPVLRIFRGNDVAKAHLPDHLDSDWRATKDTGAGTVQQMTYDGQLMSCAQAARQKLMDVLTQHDIGQPARATTAAR